MKVLKRKHEPSICSGVINEQMRIRKITPRMISEHLHISVQCVYKWMYGDRLPNILQAIGMCEMFGITLDQLCGRDKNNV